MSFKRLVLFFTFLAIFTMAFRFSIDSDTWWHLRAGSEIVENRALLTEDPFSLTRYQQPWRYPGWLAQIVIYGVYARLGYAGLNFFTALMVAVGFMWVWKFLEGPLLLRSSLLILAAVTSGVYWSARPQILSFAMSGLFIHLLERERRETPVPAWIFLATMTVWGNLHGGFAIGFILLAAYAAGELLAALGGLSGIYRISEVSTRLTPVVRRYASIFVICLIGLCLNPNGPSMILYPLKTVSIGALQGYIQEWQSPDFHALNVQPFLWMLLAAFLSFGLRKTPGHPTDYLLVLGFMFMSFWAARNIATFALATVIPISRAASAIQLRLPWPGSSKPLNPQIQRYLNLTLACLFLLAAVAKISVPLDEEFNQKMVEGSYPSGAMEYLKTSIEPAPLFNSYNWGAYLIWKLFPEYRSFVDGRTDLFDDEILEQYLAAWRGEPAWSEVFDHWGIEIALLEPSAPLTARLLIAGWLEVYQDDQSVIYIIPEDR